MQNKDENFLKARFSDNGRHEALNRNKHGRLLLKNDFDFQ